MHQPKQGIQHHVSEWTFTSARHYDDPFNQVQMDAVFRDPTGRSWTVPAFWAGGQEWKVRFSPRQTGLYTFRTHCSDPANEELEGQEGTLEARPYLGNNPLLEHGPLRVSDDHRYLQHLDGTPFFWLGDLWWLGLTSRLAWPQDYQMLVADRVMKGFTVIQVVAGLHCDMPAFDERGFNEAGHPWEADYVRINPAFFDMMDLRIEWLVRSGLVPCIFGTWGFHLLWMGTDRMKQHWRYLVARYGAYPVVWSLAGSVNMPYYLSETREQDGELLRQGWVELARYLRDIDPYGHPRVAHPFPFEPEPGVMERDGLLNCYFMHTGQGGWQGFPRRVGMVKRVLQRQPCLPVIQGEGCFEGFMDSNWEEVQRANFYALYLLGLRGLTYSANGIWQFNNPGDLFGPSANGATLGNILWQEAYRLPGSKQIGIAKRLFERYPWWELECRPDWIDPHADDQDAYLPYAAGIPRQLRIFYFPRPIWPSQGVSPIRLRALEPEVTYHAFYFDPKSGHEYGLGSVSGHDEWVVPLPPALQDWVLVLDQPH